MVVLNILGQRVELALEDVELIGERGDGDACLTLLLLLGSEDFGRSLELDSTLSASLEMKLTAFMMMAEILI